MEYSGRMKDEQTMTVHLKLPLETYIKLIKKARSEMRSFHSLAVYALAKFAEKIGSKNEKV